MSTTWSDLDSPIGPLRVHTDGTAITAVEFHPFREATGEMDDAHPVLVEAKRQLQSYFDGELRDFDLPLAPTGTEFRRRVWAALVEIPYGATTSYGVVARALGLAPGASRAVGTANGANPIPIVVPCHRVVGADGPSPVCGWPRAQAAAVGPGAGEHGAGAVLRGPVCYSDERRSDCDSRSAAAITAGRACDRAAATAARSVRTPTPTRPPCRTACVQGRRPRRRPAPVRRRSAPIRDGGSRERGGGEGGALQSAVHALGVLPGEEHLCGRPGGHGELAADRHAVTQAGRTVRRCDAHPELALPPEQLRRLAGDVAQPSEHGARGGQQAILPGGGRELSQSRAKDEPPLRVASDQPVVLQSHGEPVGRRAREPGAGHEACQRRRTRLECGKDESRFVEYADSARVVHASILPSQILKRKHGHQGIALRHRYRAAARLKTS
jgi:methylated-DNA-[protein]-cysteine S-methyltransferase